MTTEEIQCGLRDLGLADDSVRRSLHRLASLASRSPAPAYETITAAHTANEPARVANAELERGSQPSQRGG